MPNFPSEMTEARPAAIRPPSRSVISIATISRSVLRRAKHAHFSRAICGALGTFTLAIAFALERGSRLGDPEVLLLAALLALATFYSWVRSENIEAREVLERIDQRLHLAGAFLSAHESCAHSPNSTLVQLGAAKLLQRVRPGQALEAAVPHTLGFVVLPLLGLLVLVQTVQLRDARDSRARNVTVEVGTVADHLADIERMNRDALSAMQREELARIQAAAKTAAQDAADQFLERSPETSSADEQPRQDWREQLRSVADDSDRLAAEAQPGSDLAQQLADVAAEAEALAMESSPSEPSSSLEAEAGEGRFAGSEEGSGGGDAALDAALDAAFDPGPAGREEGAIETAGLPQASASGDPTDSDGGGDVAQGASQVVSESAPQGAVVADAGSDGGERPRNGLLRPIDEPDDLDEQLTPHRTPVAVGGPGSEEAEALTGGSRWWSDRDDAIVRAWLSKPARK